MFPGQSCIGQLQLVAHLAEEPCKQVQGGRPLQRGLV
jgi:hypothetical protein